jgi:hypothetical protein
MLSPSTYYTQGNRQAKSSNKTLIKIDQEEYQHYKAHRISRHGATKVTPFELVYGQNTVLPAEVI